MSPRKMRRRLASVVGASLLAGAIATGATASPAQAAVSTYTKPGSCTNGNKQILVVATWRTDTTKPGKVALQQIDYQILSGGAASSFPTSMTLADRMNTSNYRFITFDPTSSHGTWTIGSANWTWTAKAGRNAYLSASPPQCGPVVIFA